MAWAYYGLDSAGIVISPRRIYNLPDSGFVGKLPGQRMETILSIQELLYCKGLPKNAKTKLVRHKDARQPGLYDSYRDENSKFLEYIKQQRNDVFKGVEYLVAFLGETGTLSRFIGVFQVLGSQKSGKYYEYELSEVNDFKALKDRVIIDWGKGTLAWHQWSKYNTKEVIEITPPETFANKKFVSYSDITLSFSDLKEIINNQNKYKDWYMMLSSVKGIYLILDKSTGDQYIGSAYGDGGIWGRWKEYVNTGHGGNKRLINLIKTDENYAMNFQFTLLTTLEKRLTDKEVIEHERRFKVKLGTKTFGLNLN